MTEAELVLPVDASAPSKARELLATVLADHDGSERLARGQLALSEIVSNAVRHGANGRSGSIRVQIERSDGVVSVTVTQPGPIPERPSIVEMPAPWSTGGYGLAIVDTIAERWGVRVDPPSVWFELRV